MGEGLRVIAEVSVCGGVHFFRVEPQRAGKFTEIGEALARLVNASRDRERLNKPERAGKKGALGAGEAVLARRVAVEKRSTGVELLGDCVDGAANARRVGGFEVEQWEDE